MKKFVLLIICFFVLLTLSGCALTNPQVQEIISQKIGTFTVNNQTFKVEIADSPLEHYQGLSRRQSLAEDAGMLFVFDDYAVQYFIMREMNFPLDIIWIRDDSVVGCEKNVPILNIYGENSQVNSTFPVNYVLEVNAGICDKYNIKTGDFVDIYLE